MHNFQVEGFIDADVRRLKKRRGAAGQNHENFSP